MKNLKKIMASLLAIAMLASNVNVSLAADVDPAVKNAAIRLVSLKILRGDDKGDLNLMKPVTRAEAATLMVRMLDQEKAATYLEGTNTFSDMNGHWAAGNVEVAKNNGLIKGFEDGTFRPNDNVTYAQMATMMVRSLGAGEAVEARGNWPMNVMTFANANEITEDVKAALNAPMYRAYVAVLADNTLDAPLWEVTGYNTDGSIKISEVEEDKDGLQETLLTGRLDLDSYEMYEVTAKLNSTSAYTGTVCDVNEFEAKKDGKYKKFAFVKNRAITVLPGVELDLVLNDDDDVASIKLAKDSKQEVEQIIDITSISDDEIEVTLYAGDTEEYDVLPTTMYTLNGGFLGFGNTGKDKLDEAKYTPGKFIINEDGDATHVHLTQMNKAMIVKEVEYDADENEFEIKADKDYLYTDSKILYELDDETVSAYDEKSMTTSIKTLKEGDLLVYSDNEEYVKIMNAKKVTGEVTAKDNDAIEIDGKDYEYHFNFEGNTDLVEVIKVDDEVEVYLDVFDRIVLLEKKQGGENSGDYAVITEFYSYTDKEENEAIAKIVLFDLETGEYTSKMEFDAEETEDEGTVFTGYDFYTGSNVTSNDDPNEDDNHADSELGAGKAYQDLVGKVVEYDVKSGKVVIYKVETEEIAEETDDAADVSIDVSKEKFDLAGTNYYVNEDKVKVYQATELDGRELEINVLNYSDLKDSDSATEKVSMVSFDSDKEVADYVFFPLMDDNSKVTLSKTNDDYIGIVTNVKELSGNEAKVIVLTNDGEVSFYANEDEADDLSLTYNDEFVGKLVTFSMDDNSYVTDENVSFVALSELTAAKFIEVSDRGEAMFTTSSDTEDAYQVDAYRDIFVVNADITGSVDSLDNIEIASVSDIKEIDKDDIDNNNTPNDDTDDIFEDYSEAKRVYYYTLKVDSDGDLDTGASTDAVTIIIYDDNEIVMVK